MIKTIVTTAIVIATSATIASAQKCGFMCKLAYGSGYETVAEAKAGWEDKQKASAAAKMAATGKSAIVSGNYIYVQAGDAISMTPVAEVKGKTEAQVKEIIIEDVTEAIVEISAEEIAYDEAIAAGATAAEAAQYAAASAAEQVEAMSTDWAAVEEASKAASKAASIAAEAAAAEAAGAVAEITESGDLTIQFDNYEDANAHCGGCLDAATGGPAN